MVCLIKKLSGILSGKRYFNHIIVKKGYKKTATAIVVVQRPFLSPSAD